MSSTKFIPSKNKQMKIFIAGISGRVGHQIAEELIKKKQQIQIVGLCRARTEESQQMQQCIDKLEKQGVQIVEGNILKPENYINELKDTNVIVSALKGDRETIVNAQKTLLENALKLGSLEMFIPSDFTINYFNVPKGTVPLLDWRREFADWIKTRVSNIRVVHILNGCFMDTFFSSELGMCNMNSSPRMLNYYGSENTKIDLTTTRDAAKFTVEAIFDEFAPSTLSVASDVVSLKQIVDTFNKYNGQNAMKLNKLGTLEDLKDKLDLMKEKSPSDVSKWNPLAYQYEMLMDDRGKLTNIMNNRYSNVETISLTKYLETEKFSSG